MKNFILVSLFLLTTQLIISQTITVFSTGYTSLEGVAVNSSNEVFISEHDSGKVYSIDNVGVATEYASTGGFYANNIAFNAADDLFITEPFMDNIYIKNSAGEATIYIDISDNPNSLAFDSSGSLYYSTLSKIVKVNNDLTVTDYTDPFYYAEGIAFDSMENLYIADRSDKKLYKYTSTTSVLTEIANNFEGIRGVAVAPDNTVYFTMSINWSETYKILKYDPTTNTVTDFVTTDLDDPRHIAIDNLGNMYVTNRGNNTVIKIYDDSLLPTTSPIVNIPDANFKNYLINEASINTNGDDEIQVSEAEVYTGYLYPFDLEIADLTGIESFTEITDLNCSSNLLTNLDISNNTHLTSLACNINSLDNLDLSNNTELIALYCDNNNIPNIDLSNNLQLKNLGLSYNTLTNIDISNNTQLLVLNCSNNNLTSLDISNNTQLDALYCRYNSLTSLDISNNTELVNLFFKVLPRMLWVKA